MELYRPTIDKNIVTEKKRYQRDEKEIVICDACNKPILKLHTRKSKNIYRKAYSELKLLDEVGGDVEPVDGQSYHFLSGGDVDSLSYLKLMLRTINLDYCLLSTWCMAIDDVLEIGEYLKAGRIKRLDAYVGEIFPGSYKQEYIVLKSIVEPTGGRVCTVKNHSKIYAGTGQGIYFAIESSANINTNPRIENTSIHFDKGLFQFYKNFYDGLKNFKDDPQNYQKWEGSTDAT